MIASYTRRELMVVAAAREIRDGEVWICVGHASSAESLGIITSRELAARDTYIAENERKRMAYVLDHLELFASFIQWRGTVRARKIGAAAL